MIAPPLALYVHLPWCVRKCPYCDFNAHETRGEIPEQQYLKALLSDLAGELARVRDREIQTVFFGGGTPSLFSADSIASILQAVADQADLAGGAEVTLEANPGTVEHGDFSALRAAGVNRVSIGVQSFQPDSLQALGRIHGVDEAFNALREAGSAGFERINIDLMYGLPGQSVTQACADVRLAVDAGVRHISWYQLTLEPNTRFFAFPPVLPGEEQIEEMQQTGAALLEASGFARYEVSAWAHPGQACRHNLNYWQFGDYLGIGAGAHGKLTDVATDSVIRTTKARHPQAYMDTPGGGRKTTRPAAQDTIFEFMLNALRLSDGFALDLFEARTGQTRGVIEPILATLQTRSLVALRDEQVSLTPQGQRFLDNVVAEFLPTESVDVLSPQT